LDFNLSEIQQSWRARGGVFGRSLGRETEAADVVRGAAQAGLLDPSVDLLAAAVAVEAMALECAGAAITVALHVSVLRGIAATQDTNPSDVRALLSGELVGAIALSSDEVPIEEGGHLRGRASWVAPLTPRGLAIVGTRTPGEASHTQSPVSETVRTHTAWLMRLDAPGVRVETVPTAGLRGAVCGHVSFEDAVGTALGPTMPVMSAVRILLAAAGLGMGRRAMRESLEAGRTYGRTGAGGEQTVQGLLADAATDLDAAKLLMWKAASRQVPSLAEASMAKLLATEATQRAVARATQVVGSDSFRSGHVIEGLAQDVRALELFAGRTEALREAVAFDVLPRPGA
jgi:alkylation response protein AidB-like acyl-CoA dehydrogenase